MILARIIMFFAATSFALAANLKIVDHSTVEILNIPSEKSIKIFDSENGEVSFVRQDNFLKLTTELDFRKNYFQEIDGEKKPLQYSLAALNKYFYSTHALGAQYFSDKTQFGLWAPNAVSVAVKLISPTGDEEQYDLHYFENGVWRGTTKNGDYQGWRYIYQVKAFNKVSMVLDPYAKAMQSITKSKDEVYYAIIVNPKKIRSYKKHILKFKQSKYVGYEMHVRDATIDPSNPIAPDLKGTFSAVEYLIPHLKKMGVTHIQLLPVLAYQTTNDNLRNFQNGSTPTSDLNYNWGYDPLHYFVLKGQLSRNSNDPIFRINEFKQMVSTLHQSNIGVVLDVVYNHIYDQNTFENISPGAYLRYDANGDISYKSGAGASIESRNLMVRRLILDSLRYLKDDLGVDGVRFDLMGFIDKTTLIAARKALGPDFIMYGEAWEFTDLPKDEAPTKSNLPAGLDLGAFNDSSRDSYTGYMQDAGFIQGVSSHALKAKTGIIGAIKNYPTDGVAISTDPYHLFASSPIETINYLTIHDGFTLWDKLNLSTGLGQNERIIFAKQAFAMLLTSQGRVVLHGGDEFGRSKPLYANDPNPDRAHTSKLVLPENGIKFFHENSYRSSDSTNMFKWDQMGTFSELSDYVSGLIKLRQTYDEFRFERAEQIIDSISFIGPKVENSTQDKNKTFSSFDKIKLNFINGPVGKKLFVVGEVIAGENKNPLENENQIKFDAHGTGSLTFSSEQISRFDLSAWSDPNKLQIKLVFSPGAWEFPEAAYSAMGNNSIDPNMISDAGDITIDLKITDHSPGFVVQNHPPYIAYSIKANNKYQQFFVVHHVGDKTLSLKLKKRSKHSKCQVLVDQNHSGIVAVLNSDVKIKDNFLMVPKHTSTVIGCK